MAGEGVSDGAGHILAGGDRRYINRELSWLDFNRRVLALAESAEQPLLERAKFLAIFSTNLDEFFQVRVAGLKDQLAAGISGTAPDGLSVPDQLRAIRAEVEARWRERSRIYNEVVVPELATHGTPFGPVELARPGRHGVRRDGVRVADVPCTDAARRRPGPPVPVHIQPLAQPRGNGARPPTRVTGALPASRSRRCCPAFWPCPTVSASSRSNRWSPRSSGSFSPEWRSRAATPSV